MCNAEHTVHETSYLAEFKFKFLLLKICFKRLILFLIWFTNKIDWVFIEFDQNDDAYKTGILWLKSWITKVRILNFLQTEAIEEKAVIQNPKKYSTLYIYMISYKRTPSEYFRAL